MMTLRRRSFPNQFPNARTSFRLALGVSLALGGCSGKVTDRDITRISVQDAAKPFQRGENAQKTGTLLLDARPPDRFALGHLPGAQNIQPFEIDELEKDPALDRYKAIIVYAENRGDGRGMATAKRLVKARYDDIRLLEEGFEAWVAAGLPVEKRSPKGR